MLSSIVLRVIMARYDVMIHSDDQNNFLEKTCSFCSWYSARVIHMFLKEGRLAKILPPYQHIVSLLPGASTLVFI